MMTAAKGGCIDAMRFLSVGTPCALRGVASRNPPRRAHSTNPHPPPPSEETRCYQGRRRQDNQKRICFSLLRCESWLLWDDVAMFSLFFSIACRLLFLVTQAREKATIYPTNPSYREGPDPRHVARSLIFFSASRESPRICWV